MYDVNIEGKDLQTEKIINAASLCAGSLLQNRPGTSLSCSNPLYCKELIFEQRLDIVKKRVLQQTAGASGQ